MSGAGLCHLRTVARITVCDPVALVVLTFAGLVAIPAWAFGPVGIDLLRLSALPPRPSVRVLAEISAAMMLVQLLWAFLVATSVARALAPTLAAPAPGGVMPALPIRRRTRLLAEAFVATTLVVAVRAAVLAAVGEHLGRRFVLLPLFTSSAAAYGAALLWSTAAGALFAFPLVLAWTAVVRFDARGVAMPMAVAVLLLAAASVGATVRPWPAVLVCVAVSALVLVRPDDGSRPEPRFRGTRPVPTSRPSPGPLAQLRRDAWRAPLGALWPLLVVAVPLPLAVLSALPRDGRALPLLLLQLMVLAALPFFPLGLRLTPSLTGSALFGGHLARCFSRLPVPRERVARVAYFHGLVSAGLVWLVLCLQVWIHGGGPLWPAFEAPAVFLAGAIVLCEAVGDRGRGLLAVACLVGFQMVLPVAFVAAGTALGVGERLALDGTALTIAAFALGLLGGLPPLVHLRRGGPAVA